MAANNYFGFSHGGTQYGAQPATAYAPPPAQTAYVQPAPQAAYATQAPPRQQTYETYQAAPAPTQYTYAAARTQVQPQAPTYDTSKTYYTPTVAAAPAAPTTVYTVAETTYQPGNIPETTYQPAPSAVPVIATKPAYQTTSYSQPQPIRQTTAIKPQQTSHSYSTYTSNNPSTTAATTSSNNTKLNSYDAALYSAATNYYHQQQTGTKSTTNTWQKKGTFTKPIKPKQPPKQTQFHYCEVCKISCAGPQTYREHLDGQKHKKKEAALKATTAVTTGRTLQNQLRCELCDVTCTGSDAYAAHIRGAKHQKVVKLHTKLGKPIPSTEPTVVASTASTTTSTVTKAQTSTNTVIKTSVKSATATTSAVKKVLATPKITFVGAGALKSAGQPIKEEPKPVPKEEIKIETPTTPEADDGLLPGEKDVTPVGFEYIEEVKNEFGKVVSFHCKLCECKFNDPNAKLMHMKGRRHRLQYKKKVDPNLAVEVKPSIRMRKIQEDKLRRQAAKEEYWRRRDIEERWREEMRYMMMYEQPSYGYGYGQGMPVRRPDSLDDRHVMAKHATIYPNEEELQAVQSIVSSCEKALKSVSDQIADSDHPKPMETDKKEVKKPEPKKTEVKKPEPKKIDPKAKKPVEEKKEEEKKEPEKKEETPPAPRVLKGVMRVGVLAKGLLLHSDLNVHLVVLCAEKPTRTLLERVASGLPKHLNAISTEEKYEVKMCVEEAAVIVTSEKDPKTSCAITMTSPVMRDESNAGEAPVAESSQKPDPPDVLDRQKCLDALAALRHAKWFQARANGLQSCVVVIRTLRDLCQRVPTWTPLNQWAMELLVEKCVSSGGVNMSPGDALRRVFECISSGILLPGGPGLHDPCEKEPTDAAIGLTNQEREDITASAQHALRLIAFRQIHKVLGMDALPAPKFQGGKRFNPRKRKATGGSENGDADAEGKKDKKEEETKK